MAKRRKDEAVALGGAPGGPAPCEHCAYDLTGLDTLGPCPECGKAPRCIACSYDLAGIAAGAACPECGLSASATLRGDLALSVAPAKLARLHLGLNFAIWGMALFVGGPIAITTSSLVIRYLTGAYIPQHIWYVGIALAVATIVCLFGLRLVASAGLKNARKEKQRAARATLGASALVLEMLVALLLAAQIVLYAGHPSQAIVQAAAAVSAIAMLVALVALAVVYWSSLLVVRRIAVRVPDRALVRFAGRMLAFGPLFFLSLLLVLPLWTSILGSIFSVRPQGMVGALGALGSLALALAATAICFLCYAMYWRTLDRLRKAVKRVRRAAETVSA